MDLADHLAAVIEEQFLDPAATLALVTAEAMRMIAAHEASTGGVMTSQPTAPSKSHRAYNGFERESATYRRHKPELLAQHEGKFVVVVGEEIIGPFDSFSGARREGYDRFGLGPLYVKQLLAEEPVVHTSRDL